MRHKGTLNMIRSFTGAIAFVMVIASAPAQTTLAPMPSASPTPFSAAPAAGNDAMAPALMKVREAIGRQDFPAAKQALDNARQINPNHPSIALYESLLARNETREETSRESVLPTPRPGVTPIPTPEAIATPVATPAAAPASAASTPAPTTTASGNDIVSKAKSLLNNEMVRYGIIGALALIAIWFIYSFLKKRKNTEREDEGIINNEVTPVHGIQSIGGMDDHLQDEETSDNFGLSDTGLSTQSAPTDFSSLSFDTNPATPEPTSPASAQTSSGSVEFAAFDTGDDEEESAPKPPRRTPPKPQPEDDSPVSIFDNDEPEQADKPLPAKAPAGPVAASEDVSFESLGISMGGDDKAEPAKPEASLASTPQLDDTVILTPPENDKPTLNQTPLSSQSLSGIVDLDDVLGQQADTVSKPEQETLQSSAKSSEKLPDAQPKEDVNSETLSTFVSSPGVGNPEDSVEVPQKNQRRQSDDDSNNDSISMDELFGPDDQPEADEPTTSEPEPAREPQPELPTKELSIEDALAAAVGSMSAEEPETPAAPAEQTVGADESKPTESLDERTERMFADQMEKARNAVEQKNWRQAVHVLSIASALHPDNDEAKQLLKEARTEKRKTEESV